MRMTPRHRRRAATGLWFLVTAMLAGCVVGPNYRRPEATTIPAAYAGASGEWKLAAPSDHLPKGNWWEMFGDPELNRLEADVLSANQELRAAAFRFEQARAVVDVARSGLYLRLGISATATAQHDSANVPVGGKPGQTYANYRVPFDVGYELDLWGKVRRRVEAARAQAEAAAADVEFVKLALQAEVAADYFTLHALDAEVALLRSSVEVYRKSLELTRSRRAGGIVSDLDVAQAETVLSTAEAQLDDTVLQRARFEHALATLTGRPASSFTVTERPLEPEPVVVPPGLPSELLERRPDIAAAERRMAAANAGIGVAKAAFFPTIRLGGAAGLQSGDLGTLFRIPSLLWAVGPSVTLPLFQGGELRASLRGATSSYEEAVARYRQAVLVAFQDVENNLSAQRLLALELEHATAALEAARKQLEIANNRYRAGLVIYLQVATAQNLALERERALVRLRGQRFVTAVALVKSLGGGWQGLEGERRADSGTGPRTDGPTEAAGVD
jgi:multidrug efflux system outer membrane protein